jgi:uncharacterized DUF497 family protein
MGLIFEWYDNKGTANAIKHGVAFTEAGTIFGDEQSITIPDFKHSQKEPSVVFGNCIDIYQNRVIFSGWHAKRFRFNLPKTNAPSFFYWKVSQRRPSAWCAVPRLFSIAQMGSAKRRAAGVLA